MLEQITSNVLYLNTFIIVVCIIRLLQVTNLLSMSFSTVISTTEEPGKGVRGFTRDPSQLQGSILQTALRKSPQGFGFTIIGGDRPDEFLQVKNVLPDGPAAHDNKIASGNFLHRPNIYKCALHHQECTLV